MKHAYLTSVVILSAALAGSTCGGAPTKPAAASTPGLAHLNAVIALMREHSVKRLAIDWDSFTARVLAAAGPAQSISETFSAIRLALELIGDGHSSYRAANGTFIFVRVKTCSAFDPPVPSVPSDIGYVKVRPFSGTVEQATQFASELQETIRAADRDGLAGWIVDLRSNGGGNMWPMIAGVGPVLGEGTAGHFIDPTGAVTEWGYTHGASTLSGSAAQLVPVPYRLLRQRPRVAVLVDDGISSSGEATFIAFKARQDTRAFGVPTCGLSTANRGFQLSDGATLNLTVSVMADRTRRAYGDRVDPDEIITGTDQVVSRAVDWLRSGS